MKSTMKSSFAIIAVALMVMVAIVPMALVFTGEDSSATDFTALAADTPYLANGTVKNATPVEVVGATLTFVLTADADITADFEIIDLIADEEVEYVIDGATLTFTLESVAAVGGFNFKFSIEADAAVAAAAGFTYSASQYGYTATVATKFSTDNLKAADPANIPIAFAEKTLTALVKDAGDVPLSGASIASMVKGSFLAESGANTTDADGAITVITADDGYYTLGAISKTGYTFAAPETQNANNVVYNANEFTASATVKDARGQAIAGSTAKATVTAKTASGAGTIVLTGANGTQTLTLSTTTGTATVDAFGTNGNFYVTYKTGVAPTDLDDANTKLKFVGTAPSQYGAISQVEQQIGNDATTLKKPESIFALASAASGIALTVHVDSNPGVTIIQTVDGNVIASKTSSTNDTSMGTVVLDVGKTVKTTVIDEKGIYSFTVEDWIVSAVASKTFTAVYDAAPVTISGTVTDSTPTTPVAVVAKLTYTYTFEGVTETKEVKSTGGAYSITVPNGSAVSITKIEATGYTFPAQSVDLGVVTENISEATYAPLAFKAYEYTLTTGVVQNADGNTTAVKGSTVKIDIYEEEDTDPAAGGAHTFTYTVTSAKVTLVSDVSSTGVYKFSYQLPTAKDNVAKNAGAGIDGKTYKYFILVSGQTGTGVMTFDVTAPETKETAWTAGDHLGTRMSAYKTAAEVKAGAAFAVPAAVKSNEHVIAVNVGDSAGTALDGVTVTAEWWTGEFNNKTYSNPGTEPKALGASDAGVISIVYTARNNTEEAINVMLLVKAVSGNGFTFNTDFVFNEAGTAVDLANTGKGVAWAIKDNQAAGANAVLGAVNYVNAKIKADEKVYTISGAVEGATDAAPLEITYKVGGQEKKTLAVTAGYAIKVAAGSTVTDVAVNTTSAKITVAGEEVDNPVYNFVYLPISYDLGVVAADKDTCAFTKSAESISQSVVVSGLSEFEDVAVTLTYASESTSAVSGTITKQSNYRAVVVFEIDSIPSDVELTYSVAVDGYVTPKAGTGTAIAVNKSVDIPIVIYDGEGSTVAAMVPYKLYKSAEPTLYTGYLVSGEDGKVTLPANVGYKLKVYDEIAGAAWTIELNATGSVSTRYYVATLAEQAAVLVLDYDYTVQYYLTAPGSDDVSIMDIEAGSVAPGSSVVLKTKDIDGYTFVGWYVAGSLVSESLSFNFTPDADGIVVKALYKVAEAVPEPEPVVEKEFDSLTLIVGIIAIIIAIIGLALVLISRKQ